MEKILQPLSDLMFNVMDTLQILMENKTCHITLCLTTTEKKKKTGLKTG